MVTPEYKKNKRYIWGLTDDIQGNVTSSKPTKIHEAICMAHDLMDQVVRSKAAKGRDNKRKWDDNKSNSRQQSKRQEVVRAFTTGMGERRGYVGTAPLCNRSTFHHIGHFSVKCKNCNKIGHIARDCGAPTQTAPATTPRDPKFYFKGGMKGHYKSDCSKLKNQAKEIRTAVKELRKEHL
ncbi:reverse transcriptase domain-containing protein [Tanacetum coccineum]